MGQILCCLGVRAAKRYKKNRPEGRLNHFTQRAHCELWICWKKSLPLSSTRINAGKSSTSIFQMATIPSSGYATHSRLRILCCASTAAGPPMLEVETAVFMTGVGHLLAAVAFG